MKWLTLVLVAGSAIVLWPFAPWMVLAVWTAVLAHGIHLRLSRAFGDRPRLAAAVTMGLLVLFAVPAALLLTLLASDAIDLVRRLMATDRAQELLRQLVSGDARRSPSSPDVVGLVMSQGERAWGIAQQVAGTAARTVVGLVILFAGVYAMLVDGERWYTWLETHAPIAAPELRRFANAFVETGRGLLVGSVGAALTQGIVATIFYFALGVPQPLALGLLTFVLSAAPAIGTAFVWIPVAAGLALTGRTGAAVVLLIGGLTLISTVDNLARPYLTRRGHLQLPTYVVLVAMFGGIVIMGAWGVFIAPLVVRLAKEALAILGEQREAGRPT